MQEEDVKDIPLVYPLVSVTLKSVSVLEDGRRIQHECEEIINVTPYADVSIPASINPLLMEFMAYVQKVIDEATSPQGRAALQNILDTHSQGQSPTPASPPLMPGSLEGLRQRTLPSGPPAPLPDKASL